jgi:hypothetical protein
MTEQPQQEPELAPIMFRVPRRERQRIKRVLKANGISMQAALDQAWRDLRDEVDSGSFVLRARGLRRD